MATKAEQDHADGPDREVAKLLASPNMFQVILSAVTLARRGKFGARDTAAEVQNKIVTASLHARKRKERDSG